MTLKWFHNLQTLVSMDLKQEKVATWRWADTFRLTDLHEGQFQGMTEHSYAPLTKQACGYHGNPHTPSLRSLSCRLPSCFSYLVIWCVCAHGFPSSIVFPSHHLCLSVSLVPLPSSLSLPFFRSQLSLYLSSLV